MARLEEDASREVGEAGRRGYRRDAGRWDANYHPRPTMCWWIGRLGGNGTSMSSLLFSHTLPTRFEIYSRKHERKQMAQTRKVEIITMGASYVEVTLLELLDWVAKVIGHDEFRVMSTVEIREGETLNPDELLIAFREKGYLPVTAVDEIKNDLIAELDRQIDEAEKQEAQEEADGDQAEED
jgi:hypothetical protein